MTFTMSGLLVPAAILLMFGYAVPPVYGVCTLNQLQTCVPAFIDVCNIGIATFSCQIAAESCLTTLSRSCDTTTYSHGYVNHLTDVVKYMCGTDGSNDLSKTLVCYAGNQNAFSTVFTTCKTKAPNCIPTKPFTDCLRTELKPICTDTRALYYIDIVADAINTYVLFKEQGSKPLGSSGNTLHPTTSVIDKLVLAMGVLLLVSVYN